MIKQFIDTFLLKWKLRKLLKWGYYLYTLEADYSPFIELKNKYCLLIKNNKSYDEYYLDLAYNSNLRIDEVAQLIYDFVLENCHRDDTNFDKEKAQEISLSNFSEGISHE